MSKRKTQRRSSSQVIFWLMSMVLVGSMVISLFVVALPGPPEPTLTPLPTWTPFPSRTPTPTAMPLATEPLEATATEPVVGPELPTDTPVVTPTLSLAPSATLEATDGPIGPVQATDTPAPTGTPSAATLEFTFAVCGDSRGNPAVYRQVLDAVARDGSEFLIHTGDLVNKGTEAEWQVFRETMAGFDLPFYPLPGNHDGLDGSLEGFLAHSGAPAAHYSFDYGAVHFTLADSHNGGIGAAESAWLREDLSATRQPVKMVFLHHPPFDPDGTDHIMAYGRQDFMSLMVELRVGYVFAGHIHAYAHDEREGVSYYITGGAGAPLYTQDHPQAFYHYLRVAVRGEEVSVELVAL
ncbi:MAG: metallophosphoesterase [Anaerolineae bacterium]